MSKRRPGPSEESLAEALSRVVVTHHRQDHLDAQDWATKEGRGDRMPRFLERAIEDVPHARAASRPKQSSARYEGRNRKPYARVTYLMSIVGVGVGVAVSLASPSSVAPLIDQARHYVQSAATWNINFAPQANAATPRLRFGEALRNYTERAEAEAARANIIVSNLMPGTTLSAGEPVTETTWTLPQSGLDHVVITFPEGTPQDAMRATVEIPGNTASSSGKFSVELRQADPIASDATPDKEAASAEDEDQQSQAKAPTPVAAPVTAKPPASVQASTAQKVERRAATEVKAKKRRIARTKTPQSLNAAPITTAGSSTSSNASQASAGAAAGFLNMFSLNGGETGSNPNTLMMYSLGGPQ